MAEGPGKYDYLATYVRMKAMAEGVVVIVGGGLHGDGFSVQVTGATLERQIARHDQLVHVLRAVADQIEADAKARQS